MKSQSEVNVWISERRKAAEHEGRNPEIKFFAWDEHVPPGFSGLAVEEIRYLKADGKRTRIWSMPDGITASKPKAPGVPNPVLPSSVTRTSYEVRTIKGGKPTAIPTICITPNEAKETAGRAAGLNAFHELDSEAEFADAVEDGIYVVPVRTETIAQAL